MPASGPNVTLSAPAMRQTRSLSPWASAIGAASQASDVTARAGVGLDEAGGRVALERVAAELGGLQRELAEVDRLAGAAAACRARNARPPRAP